MDVIRFDNEYLNRIKTGDSEAFLSLVGLYRGKAIGWAKSIVRDDHLAEDVVQEAFILVQRKIDNLQNPARFNAWFRTIVRRIALNQLRDRRDSIVQEEQADERMTARDILQSGHQDPLEVVLQNENEKTYVQSLISLSGHARTLMQAYAMEELTPEEIAKRFEMAKSNVYNIISRSRIKANQERFRHDLTRYLVERKKDGLFGSKRLKPPEFSSPYSLLALSIYEVIQYVGSNKWSLTDIMGISGEAFRLNMTAGCHWRGISTFDWSYAAHRTMERLGWEGACFGRPGRSSISPEQQVQFLRMIQSSVDNGRPAIVWNLSINEFGLIFGYDDDTQTIWYKTVRKVPETYTYSQLGRNNEEPALFAAVLRKQTVAPASDYAILASIVDHALGKEPPIPGFSFGLEGYRLWIESIHNGHLDLLGHAYQVAILTESRHHAVCFLQTLSERSQSEGARARLLESARCYRNVLASLRLLYPAFPFGYGRGARAGSFDWIAKGLQAAYEAEKEGIGHLEAILKQ